MVDWFTTKIASTTKGLPHDHAIAPHRSSATPPPSSPGCYGAVTRQAEQAGCSRQTVYDHARQVEQRLQPPAPAPAPGRGPPSRPRRAVLDEPTRRRLAVTAFAMGISTRQIEDLLRVILAEDGPDHSTIGTLGRRRGREGRARPGGARRGVHPRVRTLAVDEIFFGGDRPWSGSSRRA